MRAPEPLTQVRLLRHRALASGSATLDLFAAAYFGSMFVLPLYWQLVRGQSPAAAGVLAIPQALTTGISLQVASRLVDRVAPAKVVGFGITLSAVGLLCTALLLSTDRPFWQLLVSMAVTGVGTGLTIMLTITTALRHVPDQHAPSGSTLLNIVNQISVSIGTALTSVVLASNLASLAISGAGGELPTDVDGAAAGELAQAFRHTLLLPVCLMAAAGAVALLLLPRGGHAAPGADHRLTAALAAGWGPAGLREALGANPSGVRSPYPVLQTRLADLPDPPTASSTPTVERPVWCGTCDAATRLVDLDDGRVSRCRSCHPGEQAVGLLEARSVTPSGPTRLPAHRYPNRSATALRVEASCDTIGPEYEPDPRKVRAVLVSALSERDESSRAGVFL